MRILRKQRDERTARRAVASEWMETLKSGDRRDHEGFDAWLRESPLNIECFLELEALDRQIQALDASDRPDIESIAAQARVTSIGSTQEARTYTSRDAWKWMGLAASIAAIGLFVAMNWELFSQRERTTRGEQRTLTLADGSVVRMNVETDLRIDYSADRRDIRLLSGEAIFKVAPDAVRPFVVHTPTTAIRALGTQFNVYQRQSTVVSVLEGQVQVTTASAVAPERLSAGEEAQVTQGRIQRRPHPDVAKAIAWRQGQVYFDNAPLEDIVREFNRHGSTVKITLEGIEPGLYRFGGTFNVEEPSSLADILREQQDLIVEQKGREIVIRVSENPKVPL